MCLKKNVFHQKKPIKKYTIQIFGIRKISCRWRERDNGDRLFIELRVQFMKIAAQSVLKLVFLVDILYAQQVLNLQCGLFSWCKNKCFWKKFTCTYLFTRVVHLNLIILVFRSSVDMISTPAQGRHACGYWAFRGLPNPDFSTQKLVSLFTL